MKNEMEYFVNHIIEKSKLLGEYEVNLEVMKDSKMYDEEEINNCKETILKLESAINYYKNKILEEFNNK